MKTIRVFICYKKILLRTRGERLVEEVNTRAGILSFLLNQSDGTYSAWFDESDLPAGMTWESEIYRQILDADVLLVLLAPGTSESEWVRREIALANALRISVVPIGTGITADEIALEMKALDISHLQWKISNNITHNGQRAVLAEIGTSLERAAATTMEQQQEVINRLIARRRSERSKAQDNQRAGSFSIFHGDRSIKLHVAAGDLARVRDIDVIVNSENDYMQMARVFESRTISSALRRRGSRVREGKYDDAIQVELDWQLKDRGRPVQAGEVFATSAGGPSSELATVNRARYIFHVAAVQAVVARSAVVPFGEPEQIEKCVRSCLRGFIDLNAVDGVISPPGTEQYIDQQQRAAAGRGKVASLLFPLFGTGQGGKTCLDVIEPILDGLVGFFADERVSENINPLAEIFLSVYHDEDVRIVLGRIASRLERAG